MASSVTSKESSMVVIRGVGSGRAGGGRLVVTKPLASTDDPESGASSIPVILLAVVELVSRSSWGGLL